MSRKINQMYFYHLRNVLHYKYMKRNNKQEELVISVYYIADTTQDSYDRSRYDSIEKVIVNQLDYISLGKLDIELLLGTL